MQSARTTHSHVLLFSAHLGLSVNAVFLSLSKGNTPHRARVSNSRAAKLAFTAAERAELIINPSTLLCASQRESVKIHIYIYGGAAAGGIIIALDGCLAQRRLLANAAKVLHGWSDIERRKWKM